MTAIRQIDLARPLSALDGLGRVERCMLVLRWHHRVVGRTYVAVRDGRVGEPTLAAAVRAAVTPAAADAWFDELLAHDPRRMVAWSPPAVTVAICTRERPDDLRRALAGVLAQTPAPAEILVVDNRPETDLTRRVATAEPRVRYVREDRRGLDAARNRALREARGEIVAFTDDDAVPDEGWLAALVANFSDPRVAACGGLTLPSELETEAQELFEAHCGFGRGFTRRTFDLQRDNPLAVSRIGAGANMAVRRQTLLDLGGFDERLDGGLPTRSGGDHEMFVRLLTAGHRLVYDPAAVSWHRHRRTMPELLDTVYGYGVGVYAMGTGLLLERRELGWLRLAWLWFRHEHLPALLRPRHPLARRLAWSELRGCTRGPAAWFAARRLVRQEG